MAQIITEGWRLLPHSYAIVNQFQILELSRRPELEIFHRDIPYYLQHWQRTFGIFSPDDEKFIANLPEPTHNQTADAIFRISFPFNLQANPEIPTFVFGTSEFGMVSKADLKFPGSLDEQLKHSNTQIITPSNWSKQGFIRSGTVPERITIIPHGVDTGIFKPLPEPERETLRKRLGWDRYFIFLNTGAMSGNKGIHTILKSLAIVAKKQPDVRLVLKGLNSLYQSQNYVDKLLKNLSESEKSMVLPRIIFTGNTFTFAEMAQLYQAADTYISPYVAEGFNLPVMEACACGLPVICTEGGPTDEFTSPEFTLRISSQPTQAIDLNQEKVHILIPSQTHTTELMLKVATEPEIRAQTTKLSPAYMSNNFTWKHIVDKLLAVLLKNSETLKI